MAGYHSWRTAQTADGDHSCLSSKRPACCGLSWSFGPRGRLLVWHIPRGQQRCPPGMEAYEHDPCTLPLPSYCLLYPHKQTYMLVQCPDFCNLPPGDTCTLPDSGGQWGSGLLSHRTGVFAYFKSCCPRAWLLIS